MIENHGMRAYLFFGLAALAVFGVAVATLGVSRSVPYETAKMERVK